MQFLGWVGTILGHSENLIKFPTLMETWKVSKRLEILW